MTHLTFQETAARLRVSRWTLARLVKRGELQVVEIQNAKRIPLASIEDFLARHTTTSDKTTGSGDAIHA